MKYMYICTTIQPQNIEKLCQSPVAVAQSYCPALVPKAEEIYIKFSKVLTLFHECQEIYDSNIINDQQITELGR